MAAVAPREGGRALDWLKTARRRGDKGFRRLKTDPLLDPLRSEPHFQAIERALRCPAEP